MTLRRTRLAMLACAAVSLPCASADLQLNTPGGGANAPQIAAIGPGAFVVLFQEFTPVEWKLGRVDRFGAALAPNVTAAHTLFPDSNYSIESNGAGAVLWVYSAKDGTNPTQVYCHLIDADGIQVSTRATLSVGTGGFPSVVRKDGDFLVAFGSDVVSSSPRSVVVRRVASNGTALAPGVTLETVSTGTEWLPQAARVGGSFGASWIYIDSQGDHFIKCAWSDVNGGITSLPGTVYPSPGIDILGRGDVSFENEVGIYYRDFVSPVLNEIRVDGNGMVTNGPRAIGVSGSSPAVILAPDGLAIANGSAGQVFLQRMSQDLSVSSDPVQVSEVPSGFGPDQIQIAYQDRGYMVTWNDNRSDPMWGDVFVNVSTAYDALWIGTGPAPVNAPVAKLQRPETPTGSSVANVSPFASSGFGVNVGGANIGGTEADELLTGPGPGAGYGPQLRAFDWRGAPIAKVNFYAYATLRYGVGVDGGGLDADSFQEMVTGAGPGAVFGPHVRGWNFDGASLQAISKVSFFAYSTLKFGVNARTADVDGDGFAEVVTGPGPGIQFGAHLRGFDYDGTAVTSVSAISAFVFPGTTNGLDVAGGDTDADGRDELACTAGPSPGSDTRVAVFDFDGMLTEPGGSRFEAFSGGMGGNRLSFMQWLGKDIEEELVAGRGPLPANPAEVAVFDDAVNGFRQLHNFNAYPGQTYGVTVCGAFLGF